MPNAKMSPLIVYSANLADSESPPLLFSSVRHLTYKPVSWAKLCSVTHCNSHHFQWKSRFSVTL